MTDSTDIARSAVIGGRLLVGWRMRGHVPTLEILWISSAGAASSRSSIVSKATCAVSAGSPPVKKAGVSTPGGDPGMTIWEGSSPRIQSSLKVALLISRFVLAWALPSPSTVSPDTDLAMSGPVWQNPKAVERSVKIRIIWRATKQSYLFYLISC